MKSYKKFSIIVVLLLSVLMSGRLSAELIRQKMISGDHQREYFIYLPSDYQKTEASAVVFVFHGGGGKAQQIAKVSGFNQLSEAHNFIVVYPQSVNKQWNDGKNSEKFREQNAEIDDVAWIEALIERLKLEYSIDQQRIYATGISNGGMFSQRLAIELGHRLAAIASLTAQIPEPLEKSDPSSPISVLMINGTLDEIVPYEGGEVKLELFPRMAKLLQRRQPNRGRVISTEDTIRYWTQHNGINTEGRTTHLPDIDSRDGATVERTEWINKRTDLSVVLYKVIGGGHTWPGREKSLPARVVGNVCRDFSATEVIWDFFSTKKKREVVIQKDALGHAQTENGILSERSRAHNQWLKRRYRHSRYLDVNGDDRITLQEYNDYKGNREFYENEELRLELEKRFVAEAVDSEVLRSFYNNNRSNYLSNETISFQHRMVKASAIQNIDEWHDQALTEADFLAKVSAVESRSMVSPMFQDSGIEGLSEIFGKQFVTQLIAMPLNQWSQTLESQLGHHVVKVTSRRAATVRHYSEVEDQVKEDWEIQQRDLWVKGQMESLQRLGNGPVLGGNSDEN